MVYNTQNYWVFGIFPVSGILDNRKETFLKLDLFLVLDNELAVQI
jgi:hypothetical protein